MADYNSDRTGSNIDLTLDKVDALDAKVQPTATGANVTGTLVSDGLTVENATNSTLTLKSTKDGVWTTDEVLGRIDFYGSDASGSGASNKVSLSVESKDTFGAAFDLEIKTDSGLLGPTKTATFANNGNVSFYEDTGTTAKMVWSASAEELQISSNLSVTLGSSDGSGTLPYLGFGSYWDGAKLRAQGSSYFGYALAGDRVGNKVSLQRYDSAGAVSGNITLAGNNVGIGTAIPNYKLEVNHTGNDKFAIVTNDENNVASETGMYFRTSTKGTIGVGTGASLTFEGNGTERARIDSSGNLLVATTNTAPSENNTIGTALLQYGGISASRNNTPAIDVNRSLSDGEIIRLRKDGSPVGSIGTVGTDLTIGTGNTGMRFRDEFSVIQPHNTTTNGTEDGVLSLGKDGARFKDLYLSGGVITSSDYRLKEDIQPMQSYADTVKQMNLVNFAWKESGTREDGFIAHELQALVPSAVRGDKDAINEDGEAQHQGVDPLKLIPVLAKALQEALERIEILESK